MITYQNLIELTNSAVIGGIHAIPIKYGYKNTGTDDGGVSHYHHQGFGHVLKVKDDGNWNHQTHGQGFPEMGLGVNSLAKKLRKIHGVL